jgi:hypothetical protein
MNVKSFFSWYSVNKVGVISAGCHRPNLLNRIKAAFWKASAETSGVAVDLAKRFSEMRRESLSTVRLVLRTNYTVANLR